MTPLEQSLLGELAEAKAEAAEAVREREEAFRECAEHTARIYRQLDEMQDEVFRKRSIEYSDDARRDWATDRLQSSTFAIQFSQEVDMRALKVAPRVANQAFFRNLVTHLGLAVLSSGVAVVRTRHGISHIRDSVERGVTVYLHAVVPEGESLRSIDRTAEELEEEAIQIVLPAIKP